jgi:predicted phage tail protein
MRTFTDTSVASLTRYYYRVRAYNSAGSSGFSNTVNTTTLAPRPAAPTNVAAVNKANGSALVTWTDASTNETSFDVCRRKYSASTASWSTCVKVGSVPTGTTRLLNASGNGTFRFYVRSVNAGGASAYAGPAQVTVTGG